MRKSRGVPCLITPDASPAPLKRLVLGSGNYSEAWLQQLIHDRPDILPISQIEPGFSQPVAVAQEVPCAHGYIDNLFITPAGEIIVVETKLWANVQARREVVAQALDYVAALTGLDYAGFEAIVRMAPAGPKSIYACVTATIEDDVDEAEFVDAVANNLARGRMLVIALGDGIRSEAEALGRLLQSHAGSHFTFALVELATWRNEVTGEILVVPDTLAQTVMIERGIVRLEDGKMKVVAVPTSTVQKAQTLSESDFFDRLAARSPTLPSALRSFLAKVEPLGVYTDLKASLSLKVELPDAARPINLGYIQKNGQLWTSGLSTTAAEAAERYNRALASLIGGSVATTSNGAGYVTTNGTSAPFLEALLPRHAEGWMQAIRTLIEELSGRRRGDERPTAVEDPDAPDFMHLVFKPAACAAFNIPVVEYPVLKATFERHFQSGTELQLSDLIRGLMDWLDVADDPTLAIDTLTEILGVHYPPDGKLAASCEFEHEEGPPSRFLVGDVDLAGPIVAWQRKHRIWAVAAPSDVEPGRLVIAAPRPISLKTAESILAHSRTIDLGGAIDSFALALNTSGKTGAVYDWDVGETMIVGWQFGYGVTSCDDASVTDGEAEQLPTHQRWLAPNQLVALVAIGANFN